MRKVAMSFFLFLSYVRFIPHVLLLLFHPHRELLNYEKERWGQVLRVNQKGIFAFLYLLGSIKEYRNVFYLRLGFVGGLLNFFIKGVSPMFFDTPRTRIGKGLVLQHGFSTIINAKAIGENCQIWHNVTIGLSESGTTKKPRIGNNVKICAGAIVIGDISVGDNVTIGAGSVVTKSVPSNTTVVGNPAVIINQNGQKVHMRL